MAEFHLAASGFHGPGTMARSQSSGAFVNLYFQYYDNPNMSYVCSYVVWFNILRGMTQVPLSKTVAESLCECLWVIKHRRYSTFNKCGN